MGDLSDWLAKTADEILLSIVEDIEKCLNEEPSPSTNSRLLAEFLINSFQGAMLRMKSSRDRRPLDVFVSMMNQLLDE